MKVGMNIPARHPIASAVGALEVAKRAGVDSVWAPDHLLGTTHPALWSEMALAGLSPSPDAFYDPFVCLGVVAQQWTGSIGVCVTDATRRRAADVVRTALTLHHLAPGGFELGVGAGEAENLVPFGYSFATPVAATEVFLEEVRALLDTGTMPGELAGRTGLPHTRDDLGPPRVWVAGHAPRMLRLTGEYGDGWLPTWPMSPVTYAERRAVIAAHADRAGRAAPVSGIHTPVVLGQSREYVAALLEREPLVKLAALMCPAELWAEFGLEHPAGPECRGLVDLLFDDLDPDELRALAPAIPFELVETFWFMGNVSEIVERIGSYADHGLEYVVLANATGAAGGVDEITANLDGFVALVDALVHV